MKRMFNVNADASNPDSPFNDGGADDGDGGVWLRSMRSTDSERQANFECLIDTRNREGQDSENALQVSDEYDFHDVELALCNEDEKSGVPSSDTDESDSNSTKCGCKKKNNKKKKHKKRSSQVLDARESSSKTVHCCVVS